MGVDGKFLKVLGSKIVIEGVKEGIKLALSHNHYGLAVNLIKELIVNGVWEKIVDIFSNKKVHSSMVKSFYQSFKNGDIDNIKSMISFMENNSLKDTLRSVLQNEKVASGIMEYLSNSRSNEEVSKFKNFIETLKDYNMEVK